MPHGRHPADGRGGRAVIAGGAVGEGRRAYADRLPARGAVQYLRGGGGIAATAHCLTHCTVLRAWPLFTSTRYSPGANLSLCRCSGPPGLEADRTTRPVPSS